MPALARTPIQHESMVSRTPLLTSAHTLASRKQDYRSSPISQPIVMDNMLDVIKTNVFCVGQTMQRKAKTPFSCEESMTKIQGGVQGLSGLSIKKNKTLFIRVIPQNEKEEEKVSNVTGLEPAIPRSEVWCLIHQATHPSYETLLYQWIQIRIEAFIPIFHVVQQQFKYKNHATSSPTDKRIYVELLKA